MEDSPIDLRRHSTIDKMCFPFFPRSCLIKRVARARSLPLSDEYIPSEFSVY